MKKRFCPVCGGEILFHYETPTKVFRIENGTLFREDNVLYDIPELKPYCSNDKTHILDKDLDFWQWVDSVEMFFKDKGL